MSAFRPLSVQREMVAGCSKHSERAVDLAVPRLLMKRGHDLSWPQASGGGEQPRLWGDSRVRFAPKATVSDRGATCRDGPNRRHPTIAAIGM